MLTCFSHHVFCQTIKTMEVTLTSFIAETRAAMKHLSDSLETLENYAVPAQPRSTPPSVSINPIIS